MERIELINKLKDFLDYKRFILTFCLLIFCAGLNLIYPFIYKYFIDFVLFQENIKNLLVVIFLMIFWLLLCIIINLLLCKVRTRFLTLMIRNLKNKIFDGLIECPLVYYRSKDINEIKQIIEDDVKELETFF